MEKLKQKYQVVQRALHSLKRALDKLQREKGTPDFDITRDSVIQRFEYTIELFWKFLKYYMLKIKKIDVGTGSARVVFREALKYGVIPQNQFELLIEAIANRNLTSHIYNEEVAEEIASRVPEYYKLIKQVLDSIVLKF